MKLTSAALAALCLLGSQAAHANYTFTDYGTGLAALGVVPTPGQDFSPFWGGNLLTWGGGLRDPQGATELFGNGVVHAEVLTFNTDEDITPTGYQSSGIMAFGQNEGRQDAIAGFVSGTCASACNSGPLHAAYWVYDPNNPTYWTFTDLHPGAEFAASFAQGTNGIAQVGWAQDSANLYYPLVWQGTAHSATSLPLPGALTQGAANAIASNKSAVIVGWGSGPDNVTHPLLWTPAALGTYTVTDLLPAGATFGVAVATDNNYAGGSVITPSSGGEFHAAYWHGLPGGTFADIHPAPQGNLSYIASSVYAAVAKTASNHSIYMAGLAVVNNPSRTAHAMLWVGPNFKPIDLHKTLSRNFVQSVATGVDIGGNVSGAVLDTTGVWSWGIWSNNAPPAASTASVRPASVRHQHHR